VRLWRGESAGSCKGLSRCLVLPGGLWQVDSWVEMGVVGRIYCYGAVTVARI